MSTRMDQRGTEQGPRQTQTSNAVWGWVVGIIVALLILWWIAAVATHRNAATYAPGYPNTTNGPNTNTTTGPYGTTPGTTDNGTAIPGTTGGGTETTPGTPGNPTNTNP